MTRTYHNTYTVILAVEADSQTEAMERIAELKAELQTTLPIGVRLGSPQHHVKLGRGYE